MTVRRPADRGKRPAEMRKHQDKRLSLADAVSFAVIRALALDGGFTFDRDFRDCGFDTYPPEPR